MRVRARKSTVAVLGIAAMLAALLVAPLAAGPAVAKPSPAMDSPHGHGMPCHKPAAKPCPHCPEKGCPGTASCLAKCAQIVAQAPADSVHTALSWDIPSMPALIPALGDRLIAPLLRPPIV